MPRLAADRAVHVAVLLLVGCGALVRLAQYFSGRSLWLDEAALALNVFDRSATDLADTLDYGQAAPLGFLLAVKGVVVTIGRSELDLRLVPLLCGLASLPLFYVVARRIASRAVALIGLLLFAAAEGPIYYAAEFKQYSGDVLSVLVLLALAVAPQLTWRRYLSVAVVGAVVLWFSHPSLFVLAAISTAYGLAFVAERRWGDLLRSFGAGLILVVSLGLFYAVSVRDASTLREDIAFPARLGSGAGEWFSRVVGDVGYQIGMPEGQSLLPQLVRVAAAALAAVAFVALLRRRWPVALMLGLTFVYLQIAAEAELYPLYARTMLFLVPIVLLLVADGIGVVARAVPRPAGAGVAVALTAVVVGHSVVQTIGYVAEPREKEEIAPLLRELGARWQPDDTLYLHYGAAYAFRYYAECDCLDDVAAAPPLSLVRRGPGGPPLFAPGLVSRPPQLIAGSADSLAPWRTVRREIQDLAGRERVWVLHSHFFGEEERFLEEELPRELDRIGEERAAFVRTRARLLLFDLSSST